MDWDDVRPKPQARIVLGEDLKAQSVDDLRQRIAACEAEITRLRTELAAREAHGKAASQLFKS
jgi:uncharacterized small protein (DUF1192 family)